MPSAVSSTYVKRSRLTPVAVDLDRAAVEQRLDERDDRAAPPAQVVARPVDVEEPEDRDAQAPLVRERERVCSSYIFETAYAQRFDVGGPITSSPSSR